MEFVKHYKSGHCFFLQPLVCQHITEHTLLLKLAGLWASHVSYHTHIFTK